VNATDADSPAQDLTFTLDADSLAADMTIDASSGVFDWTAGGLGTDNCYCAVLCCMTCWLCHGVS
jgi:hypothetical protein